MDEPWLTVEELTRVAFGRSPVVMANEAHSGMLRCPRTRRVGARMIRAAHELGVRRIAMEALPNPPDAVPGALDDPGGGYLAQPEMRDLTSTARELGWALLPYEMVIDLATLGEGEAMSDEFTNRRELAQAANLAALAADGEPLLVWCGNGHACKERFDDPDGAGPGWVPMGWQFARLTGIDAFAVDQTITADWPEHGMNRPDIVADLGGMLARFGGTAGILREDVPADENLDRSYDAYIASLDNAFE